VLIGASSAVQLKQSLVCLNNTHFDKIGVEQILKEDCLLLKMLAYKTKNFPLFSYLGPVR